MPLVQVKSIQGQVVGEINLPDDIFAVPYNPFPIQEIVRMQLASRHRGTHKTKDRGEVSGSTRKLYRQKGTGRARAGSIKSPLRRGGGNIFGPRPRDYDLYPPKKVRRNALKIALSKKLSDGDLEVIREFLVEEPKTKLILGQFDPDKKMNRTLVIIGEPQETLAKSLRNIPYFKVLKAEGLNLYDITNHQRIVLFEKSVPLITERLGK
jgi:large subunit ribosomal protein L4